MITMVWKPEYAEARKKKAQEDPEYRAKRNQQSSKDKIARAEYMKQYYAKNPEKFRRITQEQREARNAARRKKYAESTAFRDAKRMEVKEWQERNPEKRKAQRIAKYGIDMRDFVELMAIQNNSCAICGYNDLSNPKFFPVVDHCHKSTKVRGLLCMNCNQALGKFKDDISRLFSAAAYLHKHGSSGAS